MSKPDPLDKYNTLRRLVFSVAPPWFDKEDLVHDLWLECKDLKFLSRQVVRGRMIDHMKKRSRRANAETGWSPVEQDEDCLHIIELVDEALEKAALDSLERHLIYWKYFKGLSLKETGRKLNISEYKTKSLHNSALAKLKPLLERIMYHD